MLRQWWLFPLSGIVLSALAGCPTHSAFQDGINPACLEPEALSGAADALTRHSETFESIMGMLLWEVPLIEGDWAEHFGDARFYAPAVLVGLGRETGNACLLAFGRESLNGNRAIIRQARMCSPLFWLTLPQQWRMLIAPCAR